MTFVSFPHSPVDAESKEKSLYYKMFSTATQIVQSFRAEDWQNNPNTNEESTSVKSVIPSLKSPSLRASNNPSINEHSFVLSVMANSEQGEDAIPATPALPIFARMAYGDGSDNAQNRFELLRASTTSSATVGLSSDQAVPLLPTSAEYASSDIPAPQPWHESETSDIVENITRRNSVSSTGSSMGISSGTSFSNRRHQDVESLFSVSSTSASRAYLASQYSRSRSRAAPGRLGREFWMKDESASSCFSCNRAFTTFRRKHHCRVCGQIFCSACTQLVDGERCGSPNRRVRCCKTCEDALISRSSSDEDVDMSFQSHVPDDSVAWPDLSNGDDPHSNRIDPGPTSSSAFGTNHKGLSLNFNFDANITSNKLENDKKEAYSRLPSPAAVDDTHMARSFLGTSHTSHISRSRSLSLSRSRSQKDDDYSANRPLTSSVQPISQLSHHHHHLTEGSPTNSYSIPSSGSFLESHSHRFGSSSQGHSAISAIGNTQASNSTFSGYTPAAEFVPNEEYPVSSARFPNSATVEFNNASLAYLKLFLEQLLKDSELDCKIWKPILLAPLLQVAAGLHLELNDRLSPRDWVKIKIIPGGTPQDIDCINGSVFTHSLARRSMRSKLTYPRILIIAFPIQYARTDRYMSLEPVVAQESEYLKKLVARIVALKPSLLLSCSNISGQAINMLANAGISVAQNIRESSVFRVSKITKADILTSIDRLSASPQLGTCELFEQRTYCHENMAKTFFFFFVRSADPGRCALIRGDPEISSVIKVVMEVMAEICYSLKAETALMRDQFVIVPALNEPPAMILSSSPFVDYGMPYLQREAQKLEDEVVRLGAELDSETDREGKYSISSKLETIRSRWVATAHSWDLIEMTYPFMFNPSSHQNLMVLYSLVSCETATPCVGPDAQLVEFYLNTDQTLGKYVETNIGLVDAMCPDGCQRSLGDHYRTYVNGTGMVTVHTEKSPCKLPGLENSILMWSYCKVCEQQMPTVPMSSTTWKCSMGKYLELSFYGEPLKMRASTCSHNVYRDHTRYFGWHDYALKVEYSSIQLNEIYGPPKVLRWDADQEVELKNKTYQEWLKKSRRFWLSTLESLGNVKVEGLEEDMIQRSEVRIEELKIKAQEDQTKCEELLKQIYADSPPYDYLSLNKFLEGYQRLVDQWHDYLADFDSQYFPTERDIRRVTAQHIRGLLGEDNVEKAQSIPEGTEPSEKDQAKEKLSAVSPSNIRDSPSEHDPKKPNPNDFKGGELTPKFAKSVLADKSQLEDLLQNSDSHPKSKSNSEASAAVHFPQNLQRENAKEVSSSDSPSIKGPAPSVLVKSKTGNDINLSMPGLVTASQPHSGNRVTMLAQHFEELSQAFERERQREKERLKQRQSAIRLHHAQPVAEVFEDVSEAVEDWPQSHQKSLLHHSRSQSKTSASPFVQTDIFGPEISIDRNRIGLKISSDSNEVNGSHQIGLEPSNTTNLHNQEQSPRISIPKIEASSPEAQSVTAMEDADRDVEGAKRAEPAKHSLIQTLTNFWAERSSTRWNGIDYILGTHQHFFANSPVLIREDEPSSLIAFCLSLPDYQSRVAEFYESTPGIVSGSTPFDSEASTENMAGDSRKSINQTLEKAMLRETGTHMRYYFDRENTKVSCKIFFSEQFDAVRRKCTSADKYIQSLSRCSTWYSTGGKSGSAFLKTADDRLILKELSHAEFDAFVAFAPSYFEYISQALFHDLPTVLAKIYGVYQITMRRTQSSQVRMYVLVMENLFYGAKFSKFFDLKGSMRNRKVTETGKANEVLLDENMVEFIYESPVFVREHSKRMLRASLYNDTLFLTKMNVMDYSLVIGLSDDENVIVAGIIDYIRTYTWDKKIESWVKTRAATVGIKEPTVVSPKQYKGRFRESMERYFVMVPDCWSQQNME